MQSGFLFVPAGVWWLCHIESR